MTLTDKVFQVKESVETGGPIHAYDSGEKNGLP
jgi:hypothetical protein